MTENLGQIKVGNMALLSKSQLPSKVSCTVKTHEAGQWLASAMQLTPVQMMPRKVRLHPLKIIRLVFLSNPETSHWMVSQSVPNPVQLKAVNMCSIFMLVLE